MNEKELRLIYVWDAYCGWCYGFSKAFGEFHNNHPELPVTVLSGGLFVGEKKLPIAHFSHIPDANKRIAQLTGVQFGEAYQQLLDEGSLEMGVNSYPTLILQKGDRLIKIGGGAMSAEKLEENLQNILEESN